MAAAKKKKIVVLFDREKPTKNKQRFEDRSRTTKGQQDPNELVGILYVNKEKVDAALGEPDSLKVTIEPGD